MDFRELLTAGALALAASLGTGPRAPVATAPEGSPPATIQGKLDAGEARQRAAMLEQRRRRHEFERLCALPMLSPERLQACRVMYREM